MPSGFIQELTRAGVRVSLGHSMATYGETRRAMAEGLSGFTHLFNAMRPLAAREPGPIAAALESPSCWYGLIADGMHVAPPMLRLAMRGAGNPVLVTDAMPPVGGIRSSFMLQGKRIETRDGHCTTTDGVLAGSALDMASAVRNCVRLAGVPLTEALRFASLMPARFLGVDDRLGQLLRHFRADMVALDPDAIRATATWVAGNYSASAAP
jgi:N-acetylglucosamine-6-phosphate deacetylase